MSKIKPYIYVFIILIIIMIFSKEIVLLVANITTTIRKDNLDNLNNEAFKIKIETLEKELSDYELAYNNYKIYDANTYILAKTAIITVCLESTPILNFNLKNKRSLIDTTFKTRLLLQILLEDQFLQLQSFSQSSPYLPFGHV